MVHDLPWFFSRILDRKLTVTIYWFVFTAYFRDVNNHGKIKNLKKVYFYNLKMCVYWKSKRWKTWKAWKTWNAFSTLFTFSTWPYKDALYTTPVWWPRAAIRIFFLIKKPKKSKKLPGARERP